MVKHFIVCNYTSGNATDLGIVMLLVMVKLTYDSTYQDVIRCTGQQSRFSRTPQCIYNLSPANLNDLTILNCAPQLHFLHKTLNSNSEKQHPPLNPFYSLYHSPVIHFTVGKVSYKGATATQPQSDSHWIPLPSGSRTSLYLLDSSAFHKEGELPGHFQASDKIVT